MMTSIPLHTAIPRRLPLQLSITDAICRLVWRAIGSASSPSGWTSWRMLGMVSVFAALAGLAPAAQPPGPADLQRLVDDLASPRFTVREEAQRRLLEAGSAAREPVLRATKSDDVEQRLRAEQILREIKRAELWEPATIDLSCENAQVLDVFRAIADQSGNPVNWERTPKSLDRKVSVNWDKTPYWVAMDDTSRRAQVVPHMYDDPALSGVVLSHGTAGKYPVSYRGPLRLSLLTIRRSVSRTLDFGDQEVDDHQSLDLTFAMHWEQRFPLCRYGSRLRVLQALSDAGEDLRLESMGNYGHMPILRRQRQLIFSTRLRPPSKPTTKLTRLRVALELVAAGDYQTLAIRELRPNQSVQAAGHELRIISVRHDGADSAIVLALSRPQPYDKMNSTDMVDEYLEVLDANDKPIPFVQQQVQGNRLSVQYTVHVSAKRGAPASVRYHVAGLRSLREMEFNFENVPLPTNAF
jgi:hypothetical protein